MCGINGILCMKKKNNIDKALLKRMNDVVKYRGPDDSGMYIDDYIGLAHRRLKIIDLSKKGKQPMCNEDKSIWIIFNGEVYNFKDLRKKLEAKKHRFYSDTDTEAIIHAYEEYGESFLSKLNGMFAFALWDSNKKKLIIARDRFGQKPLFYTLHKNQLFFASEIKSILQNHEIKRKINLTAMNNFFTYRFIHGKITIFENIYRLLPGHYMVADKNGISIKKYWDLTFSENNKSLAHNVKMLNKLLEEAVEKRMISDVPLGAFIGGGIDSSAIIANMVKFTDHPIKTFTLGFEGETEEFNEFKPSKIIADHFNTDHQEIFLPADSVKLLPRLLWHYDEPVADSSAISVYILAREAAKKVTVILTGEGGDELFAGYEQYKILRQVKKYNSVFPKFAKTSIIPHTFKLLPREHFFNKLKTFYTSLDNNAKAYNELLSIFNREEKQYLYTKGMMAKIKDIDSDVKSVQPYFKNDYSLLNKMLLCDIKTCLPENLLMNHDKLGMAHSFEGRAPFLDHNLAEFTATLPSRFKLNGMNEKFILRKAMKNYLPKTTVKRKKQRFHVPIDTWYNLYLKDFSEQLLTEKNELNTKFFDKKFINKLLNYQKTLSYRFVLKHNPLTKLYYTRQLWNMLVFEVWYKIFIESDDLHKPKLTFEKLL